MSNLKEALRADLNELKQIRDELKVKVHLASMDLKDEWSVLEGRLEKVEKHAEETGGAAADATKKLVSELGDAFKRFKKELIR